MFQSVSTKHLDSTVQKHVVFVLEHQNAIQLLEIVYGNVCLAIQELHAWKVKTEQVCLKITIQKAYVQPSYRELPELKSLTYNRHWTMEKEKSAYHLFIKSK